MIISLPMFLVLYILSFRSTDVYISKIPQSWIAIYIIGTMIPIYNHVPFVNIYAILVSVRVCSHHKEHMIIQRVVISRTLETPQFILLLFCQSSRVPIVPEKKRFGF